MSDWNSQLGLVVKGMELLSCTAADLPDAVNGINKNLQTLIELKKLELGLKAIELANEYHMTTDGVTDWAGEIAAGLDNDIKGPSI